MKKIAAALFAVFILFAAGCAKNESPSSGTNQPGMAAHSHDSIMNSGGWCDQCKVGFVDGKKIDKKCCYDAAKMGTTCKMHSSSDGTTYKCEGCGKTSTQPGEC